MFYKKDIIYKYEENKPSLFFQTFIDPTSILWVSSSTIKSLKAEMRVLNSNAGFFGGNGCWSMDTFEHYDISQVFQVLEKYLHIDG